MTKISSQLKNHKLMEKLLQDLMPLIKEVSPAELIYSSEFATGKLTERQPSAFESYSGSVFSSIMKIQGTFEFLEHARVYLSRFRTNKQYEKAGIRPIHYINYHYFNSTINIVKIMDCALILTNNVFWLGNPEELCRLKNISENSWVRSVGVDKFLKELDSLVKPWRQPRNLFIHRGKTLIKGEELLIDLDMFDFAAERHLSIENATQSNTKLLQKWRISEICSKLEREETKLYDTIDKLFSALLPIYSSHSEKLRVSSTE